MQTVVSYPAQSTTPAWIHTNKRIILYIILAVALLPRLYHINQPYTDLAGWRQSSVAMMAENFWQRNPNILYPEVSWNGPGETYTGYEFQTMSYTASLLYRVFGQHEWIGRLEAVLFGVWGVFALYQLVRRVWDETHAFVSAAVLALLPGAIFFDRTFLPDPAMVSLVTTSLWLWIAYLQTDRRRYFIWAFITACLGFLTKIPGMLVLLPMLYAVIAIWQARQKLTVTAFAKLVVPALAVMGIVAAYYLWARHVAISYPPYLFAGHSNWVWDDGLKSWLHDGYFLKTTAYIFKYWTLGKPFFFLFIAGVFISLLYIQNQKRTGPSSSAPYFFHFWLAGFLFFYAIGAKEQINNFWNFHIGSPMIAAFCGSAIVFVWNLIRKWKWVSLAAGLLLFAYVIKWDYRAMRYTFNYKNYESDYNMGLHLKKLRQPNDLVLVLAHDIGSPIAVFYSSGRGWVYPPHEIKDSEQLPATDAACIALLNDLYNKGAAWFGINRDHFNTFKAAYPQFAAYLSKQFTLRADEPDYVIFQLKK